MYDPAHKTTTHTHTSSSRSLQQPSVSYRPMDGLKYIWDRVTGIFRFSSAALYGVVYDRNRKKPNRNCQSFGRISTETEIRWHQNFHISRAQRNTFSYGRPNMRGEGSKNCVKTQNTVHYLKINLNFLTFLRDRIQKAAFILMGKNVK